MYRALALRLYTESCGMSVIWSSPSSLLPNWKTVTLTFCTRVATVGDYWKYVIWRDLLHLLKCTSFNFSQLLWKSFIPLHAASLWALQTHCTHCSYTRDILWDEWVPFPFITSVHLEFIGYMNTWLNNHTCTLHHDSTIDQAGKSQHSVYSLD